MNFTVPGPDSLLHVSVGAGPVGGGGGGGSLRRRGMARVDALVEGSRERLRPILMTMGTAILAMVPIAISDTAAGGDGPAYFPMARAIAGGLAFSTVVSLLFLPTIYAILDDTSTGMSRILRRARGVPVVKPEIVAT